MVNLYDHNYNHFTINIITLAVISIYSIIYLIILIKFYYL